MIFRISQSMSKAIQSCPLFSFPFLVLIWKQNPASGELGKAGEGQVNRVFMTEARQGEPTRQGPPAVGCRGLRWGGPCGVLAPAKTDVRCSGSTSTYGDQTKLKASIAGLRLWEQGTQPHRTGLSVKDPATQAHIGEAKSWQQHQNLLQYCFGRAALKVPNQCASVAGYYWLPVTQMGLNGGLYWSLWLSSMWQLHM